MTVGGALVSELGDWNKGYPTLGTYLIGHSTPDEEILHAESV